MIKQLRYPATGHTRLIGDGLVKMRSALTITVPQTNPPIFSFLGLPDSSSVSRVREINGLVYVFTKILLLIVEKCRGLWYYISVN